MDYDKLYLRIKKYPQKWGLQEVETWLAIAELQEFQFKFISNQIDGPLLVTLEESDLIEIGIDEKSEKFSNLLQWIKQGLKDYSYFLKDKLYQEYIIQGTIEDDLSITKNQRSSLIASYNYEKTIQKVVTFYQEEGEKNEVQQYQQVNQKYEQNLNNGLILILYQEPPKQYHFLNQEISIGRNYDNTIVLCEDYISRQHCQITWNSNNQNFYLQDLGSTSGTYILLINPTLLQEQFIIQMGSAQYRIEKLDIQGIKCSVQMKIVEGNRLGFTFCFELIKNQSNLIFGRNQQLFAMDPNLSNIHAQFQYIDDGLVIEDQGSRNGTWLRLSVPQQVSEPIKLINGRKFRLAYEKVFECIVNQS
ncbi:unnamed protein product [Paramecium pentaurelia]|uniref:FHA domain-containing protein n=1 Tax=Paramecium pentaurelia TaxID=43138 RepID=A0A8S1WBZ3_9CILI|nr:unnamed protein product [Paramecium pentaurelia]